MIGALSAIIPHPGTFVFTLLCCRPHSSSKDKKAKLVKVGRLSRRRCLHCLSRCLAGHCFGRLMLHARVLVQEQSSVVGSAVDVFEVLLELGFSSLGWSLLLGVAAHLPCRGALLPVFLPLLLFRALALALGLLVLRGVALGGLALASLSLGLSLVPLGRSGATHLLRRRRDRGKGLLQGSRGHIRIGIALNARDSGNQGSKRRGALEKGRSGSGAAKPVAVCDVSWLGAWACSTWACLRAGR